MDVNTSTSRRQGRVCRSLAVALMMLVSCVASAEADDATLREAERFLELSGVAEAMSQSSEMVIDQQLQQNPTLIPFRRVMLAFFEKYVSYEQLKEEYAALYAKHFSQKELQKINDFYASGVGRKMVRLTPELMQKGSEIATRRSDQHLHELQKMMADEAMRIQNLQDQDDHFNSVLQPQ